MTRTTSQYRLVAYAVPYRALIDALIEEGQVVTESNAGVGWSAATWRSPDDTSAKTTANSVLYRLASAFPGGQVEFRLTTGWLNHHRVVAAGIGVVTD
jgi:hypothetical protein